MNDFKPKQQALLAAVTTTPSLSQADAAAVVGVHRGSISRWKLTSPDFAVALAEAREEGRQHLLALGQARMAELLPDALSVLERHLTDDDPRVRAQAAATIITFTLTKPAERHTLEGSAERPLTFTIRLDNPRAHE